MLTKLNDGTYRVTHYGYYRSAITGKRMKVAKLEWLKPPKKKG